MTLSLKKFLCLACAAAAAMALSGCGGTSASAAEDATEIITLPTAPTAESVPETLPPELEAETVTAVLKAGELYTLDKYPNLKTVDLSGSTCYDAILEFMENHSHLEVIYTVPLGTTQVRNTAGEVTLEPGSYTYESLLENLKYLPNLTRITFTDVQLDAQQIAALGEAYPEVSLVYTVELFGESLSSEITELDLTDMGSSQVEEAISKLGLLPNLATVELSNSLSLSQVAALQDSNPNAVFQYQFTLFGKTLSTIDETVEYKNANIGNEGEEQIRQALEVLDNCQRFVLDNCKLDNEVLAKIREDFRDQVKVVWRVYFGVDSRYNALTDADTIRAVYNVTDDTCTPLRYCEDVKYMDIGHNDYLTDLSFVGYMPNIEVLIASGCAATKLEGFENCKKLTWLELANCLKLEDIECLAGCESLTYLNLSSTKVSNFMALDGLPLERFVCLRPKASAKEQETFQTIHPDCLTVFYGYSNPFGYGWRYDDNGVTFNEYYENVVRKAFNYDYLETLLPKDDD